MNQIRIFSETLFEILLVLPTKLQYCSLEVGGSSGLESTVSYCCYHLEDLYKLISTRSKNYVYPV